MEHDEHVKRINELAKKAREQGLTEEESAEQHTLRRAYVDKVKSSLRPHLENIRYVDEHGNVTKPGDEA